MANWLPVPPLRDLAARSICLVVEHGRVVAADAPGKLFRTLVEAERAGQSVLAGLLGQQPELLHRFLAFSVCKEEGIAEYFFSAVCAASRNEGRMRERIVADHSELLLVHGLLKMETGVHEAAELVRDLCARESRSPEAISGGEDEIAGRALALFSSRAPIVVRHVLTLLQNKGFRCPVAALVAAISPFFQLLEFSEGVGRELLDITSMRRDDVAALAQLWLALSPQPVFDYVSRHGDDILKRMLFVEFMRRDPEQAGAFLADRCRCNGRDVPVFWPALVLVKSGCTNAEVIHFAYVFRGSETRLLRRVLKGRGLASGLVAAPAKEIIGQLAQVLNAEELRAWWRAAAAWAAGGDWAEAEASLVVLAGLRGEVRDVRCVVVATLRNLLKMLESDHALDVFDALFRFMAVNVGALPHFAIALAEIVLELLDADGECTGLVPLIQALSSLPEVACGAAALLRRMPWRGLVPELSLADLAALVRRAHGKVRRQILARAATQMDVAAAEDVRVLFWAAMDALPAAEAVEFVRSAVAALPDLIAGEPPAAGAGESAAKARKRILEIVPVLEASIGS